MSISSKETDADVFSVGDLVLLAEPHDMFDTLTAFDRPPDDVGPHDLAREVTFYVIDGGTFIVLSTMFIGATPLTCAMSTDGKVVWMYLKKRDVLKHVRCER